MINLIKKNFMKFILVLMLIWTVINIFTMGQLYASGMFCLFFVTTVNIVYGKKYGIPFAVVGVVWLVISIILHVVLRHLFFLSKVCHGYLYSYIKTAKGYPLPNTLPNPYLK